MLRPVINKITLKSQPLLSTSDKKSGVVLNVTMPALEQVRTYGAADLTFEGFTQDEMQISVLGASSMKARDSSVNNLVLEARGASRLDLRGIAAKNASLDVSGASRITLKMVGGELSGKAAGAGHINYCGTTSSQSLSTSGVASVNELPAADCL